MITGIATTPKRLSREKNVARYVGKSHFDPNTGGVGASAFDRMPKDTDGLSVTQCGIFAKTSNKDDAQIRRVVGSRMKLGATACFAQLNVGAALDALTTFENEFYFQEDPLFAENERLANPAHALLIGLPFKDEAIGTLKAELAGDLLKRIIQRTFPAIESAN